MKGEIKYCPVCHSAGDRISKPKSEGLDPRMHKYRCRKCRTIFYSLLRAEEVLDVGIQERAA